MTLKAVLKELKALGDESVRARNANAGAGEKQFGVKLGDLRTLAKKVKVNHELALGLWETGNLDARLLAILLMKPKSLSAEELDRMVRSAGVAQLADWLNGYIVKQHPDKEMLRQRWMSDGDPWALRAGWALTAERAGKAADGLDLAALLDRIETEMSKADPAAQWTMNNTLIAIGVHHAEHRKRAIAIGERIGLYRDWPASKGCTPPYVPVCVPELVRRMA